jgi:DNA primase small subunit
MHLEGCRVQEDEESFSVLRKESLGVQIKLGVITREEIIRRKFREFYEKKYRDITYPTRIMEREFGFLVFKEGIMVRHRSFRDYSELQDYIRTTVPSDAYYSTAYYQRPEEEMEKKGWLGTDLCFDIDADHLNTVCKQTHDSWKCLECGKGGFGEAPKKCPKCKGKRFEEKNWFCKDCLQAAKDETIKLIDVLKADFGLPLSKLEACFSGNRGFHIHVEDKGLIGLDQWARKEIVDYLLGSGIDLSHYGIPSEGNKRGNIIMNVDSKTLGWGGRVIKYIYDYLSSADEKKLKEVKGIDGLIVKTILENRESILSELVNKAALKTFEGLNVKTWEDIAESALKANAIKIDTVVTIDIHRLIRLPYTLHRKTGFKVVVIPVEELAAFDPFADAVAFKDGVFKVHVQDVQRFEISKTEYGPYKDEVVELPTAAAMLLLCKGFADPV